MLPRVLLFLFALGAAGPATGSPLEDIRALAMAGDAAAVETRIAELHETARESGDFDAVRAVNAQVFAPPIRR